MNKFCKEKFEQLYETGKPNLMTPETLSYLKELGFKTNHDSRKLGDAYRFDVKAGDDSYCVWRCRSLNRKIHGLPPGRIKIAWAVARLTNNHYIEHKSWYWLADALEDAIERTTASVLSVS